MIITCWDQKDLKLFVVRSEHLPQDCIVDVRFAQAMIVEPHVALSKLIYMNRNRRNKISHCSFNRIYRNTPYAKETKYMINPECIVVITHLHKTLMPPFKTIL